MHPSDKIGYQAKLNRQRKRFGQQRAKQTITQMAVDRRMQGVTVKQQHTAYVYIIRNSAFPNWYKVGTCISLEDRLQVYQTSDPLRRYEYVASYITSHRFDSESAFHKEAAETGMSISGEWVQSSNPEIVKQLLLSSIKKTKRIKALEQTTRK